MDNSQTQAPIQQSIPVQPITPVAQPASPPPSAIPPHKHTAEWLMLTMLFIFPPLGWFFMWKEKEYHGWFATTIFIYGLSGFVLNALIIVLVAPYLPQIYSGLGIADPSEGSSKYMLALGIVISDAMMFFGIYIWGYVKKHGQLDGKLLIFTAILLFINYIVPTVSAILSLGWILNTLNEVTNAAGNPAISHLFQSDFYMR